METSHVIRKTYQVADFFMEMLVLNPSRPDPGGREKINLNFYFHTSLWCLN